MKFKTALHILFAFLGLVIIFHVLILLKIIPYHIAWGGRLKTDSEMYVFETISILINLLLIFVLLIKGAILKPYLSQKFVRISLIIFALLFALNTIGNLFAVTFFEKCFAIVTALFTYLLYVIINKEKNQMP